MILDKNKELIYSYQRKNKYNNSEILIYKSGDFFNLFVKTTVAPSGERNLMVTLNEEELTDLVKSVSSKLNV